MESHGEAGKIHCSEEVYATLYENSVFEERGFLEVKGKRSDENLFSTINSTTSFIAA